MFAPGVIEAFVLYTARSSAMVISAPLIGMASGFAGYKVALIFGVSFLMYSVGGHELGHVEPILLGAMTLREVLIAAGADLSVVVSDGDTALDKAIFWEHVECEQLLRSHGAATAAKPVVVVGRGGVGLAALHAGSH